MSQFLRLITHYSLLILIILIQACKPKEVVLPNETELITTVKLSFTDSSNVGNILTFVFRDIDGAGGNAPTQFDTIKLNSNKTYTMKLVLLDESKTPTDSTSNEVLEEGIDHQFFFNISSGLNITTSYQDLDANSKPIGIQSKWETGAIANGTATVVLKHQPGIKDGNQATGETDVEVVFPVRVE